MNDRTFKALSSANIQETPLASLDYEQQLFALTPQHLLFHPRPEAEVQQVALKDITRIHSDQTGTLRVETGEQTAITASLIGYDPGRVQRFFQLVRDTTARVKQTPAPPIVPVAPSSPFGKASAAPSEAPRLTPPAQAPTFAEPVSRTVITPVMPDNTVITPVMPASTPPAPITPLSAIPVPAPVMPAPAAIAPAPATLEVTLAQAALLRRARSVGRLAGICVLLALVLVAGSLGMGYIQWEHGTQAQQLTALWTVTMGIVTAVALLVLAEMVRFLSALGHASAEQR